MPRTEGAIDAGFAPGHLREAVTSYRRRGEMVWDVDLPCGAAVICATSS